MRSRYHIPARLQWQTEVNADERARLANAITAAIRRTVESAAGKSNGVVSGDFENSEALVDLFSSDRYRPDRYTYAIPSYDKGGNLQEVPVEHSPASDASPAETATVWTNESIRAHLAKTFGSYDPHGQTYYGVQTPQGFFFADSLGGDTVLKTFRFGNYKKDVKRHWESTGTQYVYPRGRYAFTVTGKAEGDDHPFPNVAIITDFQGKQYGDPIYTPADVGFRIVFDVPETIQTTTEAGGGGATHGIGILPEGGLEHLILLRCRGYWDTNPLSDPAYAGMSDDDLWRLFLNLCNARAIDNLAASEDYIRDQLAPRYTGPGRSPDTLSDYSRHNVKHFQEDLQLLRGLLLASNSLWTEIYALEKELNSLTMTRHRTAQQYQGFFGGQLVVDAYWPTFHEPAPADRPRVEELMTLLRAKGESATIVMHGILRLVQEDPFLTQFISGLELSGDVASAPDRKAIEATLADVPSAGELQHEILKKLNTILKSIVMARHKLCYDPERILDVPIVYEKVLAMVEGVNPRFDQIARERIHKHQRHKAWVDIGMGAAGLVLFVGGLIISLAGGPAGVIMFLELSATTLGVIQAARSFDKASFLTDAANASIAHGGGLVTLEAASDARFWAKVDAVLAAVDVGLTGFKAAKTVAEARKAEAVAQLARSLEKAGAAAEAEHLLPFEELIRKAAPHGSLPLTETEVAQLQALGTGLADSKLAGRIAEEAAERAAAASNEYVQLATKFKQGNLADVGIDLLYARRQIFEKVFGKLANPRDAARVVAEATEQQRTQFVQALRESSNAEDMISLEVKFTRRMRPIEELLKIGSRGGVQKNTAWYRDLMTNMLKAGDSEVQATGKLLQDLIGAHAQDLGRLSRIGIVMDTRGAFTLERLTDQVIDLASQSRKLYENPRYWGMAKGLREAERTGNVVRAQRLRSFLTTMNAEINALDAAVKQAKRAELARLRALESMRRGQESLAEIAVLSAKPQTPAVISSLHTANAVARMHLQVVQYSAADAHEDLQRANKIVADANGKYSEYEKAIDAALDEWERLEPGARERLLRAGESLGTK